MGIKNIIILVVFAFAMMFGCLFAIYKIDPEYKPKSIRDLFNFNVENPVK
jgi:hypothetical protein